MYRNYIKHILALMVGLMLTINGYTITSSGIVFALGEGDGAANVTAVLAFSSDVHNQVSINPANQSAQRLGNWIDTMKNKYGRIDAMAFAGDLGDYDSSESQFWTEAQAAIDAVDAKEVDGYFTTGNHEYDPGNFTPTKNKTTERYTLNSEAKEGDNYRIYCLGAAGKTQEYPSAQITSLTNYLGSVGNDKPIIIVTHFPLHYIERVGYNNDRTTANAAAVIDALNTAVANGTPDDFSDDRKIVFLWGHNHTNATSPNSHYDNIYKAGDELQTTSSSDSKRTIQFYYAAAGCMSDSEYSSGSAAVKGKGLIITVNSKGLLSFEYNDVNGNDVTKGGKYTELEPEPVERMMIDEAVNGEGSGVIGEDKTLQLHTSVFPETATNGPITWKSSNDSVVFVDSSGMVTGVSEGTAEITATLIDRVTGEKHTASIIIEVIPAFSRYIEVSELTDGKEYIIAVTKDSSSVYAVDNANGSGQISSEALTITPANDNDLAYIRTDKAGVGWTYKSSGKRLTNQGNHLDRAGSYGNYYPAATTGGREVTYTDGKLQLKNSSGYSSTYYLTCSNGTFGLNSSSGGAAQVRLFERSDYYIRAFYIRFEDEDGNLLQRNKVAAGQNPAYTGETPVKAATYDYTYTFAGWTDGDNNYGADDELPAASENKTYKAIFDAAEIHHHSMTPHEAVEPGCTEAGNSAYWSCDGCNKFFADEAGEHEINENDWVIPAAHDWSKPTYVWAADNSSVTAEYHCMSKGCTEEVTETVQSTSVVTKQPTCTAAGETKYSASFTDPAFVDQEKKDVILPAGHHFGSWQTTVAATETSSGKQIRRCSCGQTETQTIKPLAPTLPQVKISNPKAGKKSATIKWKKVSKKKLKKIKKIQIQYSKNKNFTSGVKTKYVSAGKTSATIKIPSKKRYYVRIRAYTNGHVSAWSDVKSVKAK